MLLSKISLSLILLVSLSASAAEISASNEASFSEMLNIYSTRVSSFNRAMHSHDLSRGEKLVIAKNFMNYAETEIKWQTDQTGITYSLLMSWHSAVKNKLAQGQLDAAIDLINNDAVKILNLIN